MLESLTNYTKLGMLLGHFHPSQHLLLRYESGKPVGKIPQITGKELAVVHWEHGTISLWPLSLVRKKIIQRKNQQHQQKLPSSFVQVLPHEVLHFCLVAVLVTRIQQNHPLVFQVDTISRKVPSD